MSFASLSCGTRLALQQCWKHYHTVNTADLYAAFWFWKVKLTNPSGQPERKEDEGSGTYRGAKIICTLVATAHFCFHFIDQNTGPLAMPEARLESVFPSPAPRPKQQ